MRLQPIRQSSHPETDIAGYPISGSAWWMEESMMPRGVRRIWSAVWPWMVIALYLYVANDMAAQLARCEWPQW
jgi:hypothetical protein